MKCTFGLCQREASAKAGFGLCGLHYGQRRAGLKLSISPYRIGRYAIDQRCAFDGCQTRPRSGGLCWSHAKIRNSGAPLRPLKSHVVGRVGCRIADCDGEHNAHGLCLNHYTIWRLHGIEPELYEKMFVLQDNVCAICHKECVSRRRLSVDHDHETGEIRGLLCAKCNRAIGLLRDDPALVEEAARYLRKVKKPRLKVA